jgi:putative phosphoribosyl transferase
VPDPLFADRDDAGRALAQRLARRHREEAGTAPVVVLALPRGGVPVAAPVAAALDGTLEVVVAVKVSQPGHPEVGIGAVAEDGPPIWDLDGLWSYGLDPEDDDLGVERVREEVRRRIDRYRSGRPLPPLADREVVVVDDGVATGVTVRATLSWLRHRGPAPRRLVVATPVCSRYAFQHACADADEVVSLAVPEPFGAVSTWYDDFAQLTDAEVHATLSLVHDRVEHG